MGCQTLSRGLVLSSPYINPHHEKISFHDELKNNFT